MIDRLTQDASVEVAEGYIDNLRGSSAWGGGCFHLQRLLGEDWPVPKGMPVNLIANMDLLDLDASSELDREAHRKALLELLKRAKSELKDSKDIGRPAS